MYLDIQSEWVERMPWAVVPGVKRLRDSNGMSPEGLLCQMYCESTGEEWKFDAGEWRVRGCSIGIPDAVREWAGFSSRELAVCLPALVHLKDSPTETIIKYVEMFFDEAL